MAPDSSDGTQPGDGVGLGADLSRERGVQRQLQPGKTTPDAPCSGPVAERLGCITSLTEFISSSPFLISTFSRRIISSNSSETARGLDTPRASLIHPRGRLVRPVDIEGRAEAGMRSRVLLASRGATSIKLPGIANRPVKGWGGRVCFCLVVAATRLAGRPMKVARSSQQTRNA